MLKCPVCAVDSKEYSTFLSLASHMQQSDRSKRGKHQEYLDLITNKSFGERAYSDAYIARLLQKDYKKNRHLPTLDELRESK
jgi:hypothetical protein